MIRDFVEHGTHDAEEYPFSEELQVIQCVSRIGASIVKNIDTNFFACLVGWLDSSPLENKNKIKARTLKYDLSCVKTGVHVCQGL